MIAGLKQKIKNNISKLEGKVKFGGILGGRM
jgi:hypothetical protein